MDYPEEEKRAKSRRKKCNKEVGLSFFSQIYIKKNDLKYGIGNKI